MTVQPGEQRRVTFQVTPSKDFAHYEVAGKAFVVEPGDYEIQAGSSSRDIRLTRLVHVR